MGHSHQLLRRNKEAGRYAGRASPLKVVPLLSTRHGRPNIYNFM